MCNQQLSNFTRFDYKSKILKALENINKKMKILSFLVVFLAAVADAGTCLAECEIQQKQECSYD